MDLLNENRAREIFHRRKVFERIHSLWQRRVRLPICTKCEETLISFCLARTTRRLRALFITRIFRIGLKYFRRLATDRRVKSSRLPVSDEPIVPRLGLTKSGERKVSITWTSGRKDKNAKVRLAMRGRCKLAADGICEHDTGDKRPILWRTANGFGYRHSGYQHYAEIENKVDNKRAFEYQLGDDVSEFEES